ncbi:MAG: hypothetical protein M1819_005894 [Sarea resinae]|nr:MAG: hypothetical protein M1819_005894 [Sarea resinae]
MTSPERDSVALPMLSAPSRGSPELASDTTHLGKPSQKASFDKLDFGVVLSSFACLIAGICAITPHLTVSWRLGYTDQLVLIGFLLSVMNLLLKKLTPTLLLSIEARWGNSTLQNYDAILRNALFETHTALVWRLTILLFVLLPLGLSVGYKRFTGGISSANITNRFSGRYGLTAPPGGSNSAMNNSIYYAIDANAAFSIASSDESALPMSIPGTFGYNTFVPDSGTAALLDMPLPDYTSSIQGSLAGSDYWTISASVNATVARYNESTSTLISDYGFWNASIDDSWNHGFGGVSTLYNWDSPAGVSLGWLGGLPDPYDGSYLFTGDYPWTTNPYFWFGTSETGTEDWAASFRKKALMFNVRREQCVGTWQINRTDILLSDASCTGILSSQTPFTSYNMTPFPLDAMPVLIHALSPYFEGRNGSLWRLPAYTTSVATAYWARYLHMVPGSSQEGLWDSELNYPATNERIVSTISTLRDDWLLYGILAVQPVLALVIFMWSAALYSTPLGKGFGMVAIMSGVQRNSLDLLSGAAFSGELEKPVKLTISVEDDSNEQGGDQKSSMKRIQYEIGGILSSKKGLRKRTLYS